MSLSPRFVRKMQALQEGGLDLSSLVRSGLREMLGESAADAIIYIVRYESLNNPRLFADRTKAVFGYGSEVILDYLLNYVYTKLVPTDSPYSFCYPVMT